MQLWQGRFQKALDPKTNDFNSSIAFDSRMYKDDIDGSIAHATMLCAQNIISADDLSKIVDGLKAIKAEIENGTLEIDPNAEDIHTFVEGELTKRVGAAGKRLHTARSRNDQVALDVRLYLRRECNSVYSLVTELIGVLCKKAEKYADAVMPGYTHMQRAQPITFGHHLLAYAEMLLRDRERIADAQRRMNYCPLGSCALAGTTYNTDREMTAEALGFTGPMLNSLDGVSDRDFCMELASALSILMVHLSRFSEEIILWCSWEFKFVELDDAFSTGSSIMPQKKNPDICELIRGKTGRVYGALMGFLTTMKGLPLAYNKDMQEDKEMYFDALNTTKGCLQLLSDMLKTTTFNKEKMKKSATGGFTNATDAADYLVNKGVPFRDAHGIIGQLVLYAISQNKDLDELTLEEFKNISDVFEEDVYQAIDVNTCVNKRNTIGACGQEMMKKVITLNEEYLKQF